MELIRVMLPDGTWERVAPRRRADVTLVGAVVRLCGCGERHPLADEPVRLGENVTFLATGGRRGTARV